MESPDEWRRRIRILENRISNLCAAVLRVSATLTCTRRWKVVSGSTTMLDGRAVAHGCA